MAQTKEKREYLEFVLQVFQNEAQMLEWFLQGDNCPLNSDKEDAVSWIENTIESLEKLKIDVQTKKVSEITF